MMITVQDIVMKGSGFMAIYLSLETRCTPDWAGENRPNFFIADFIQLTRPVLFFSPGKNRLEVRRLFFPRHNADFDFLEACRFQPVMQITFGKSQPAIAVKLACFLEIVFEQIEDQNLSVRLQQLCCAYQ